MDARNCRGIFKSLILIIRICCKFRGGFGVRMDIAEQRQFNSSMRRANAHSDCLFQMKLRCGYSIISSRSNYQLILLQYYLYIIYHLNIY